MGSIKKEIVFTDIDETLLLAQILAYEALVAECNAPSPRVLDSYEQYNIIREFYPTVTHPEGRFWNPDDTSDIDQLQLILFIKSLTG